MSVVNVRFIQPSSLSLIHYLEIKTKVMTERKKANQNYEKVKNRKKTVKTNR